MSALRRPTAVSSVSAPRGADAGSAVNRRGARAPAGQTVSQRLRAMLRRPAGLSLPTSSTPPVSPTRPTSRPSRRTDHQRGSGDLASIGYRRRVSLPTSSARRSAAPMGRARDRRPVAGPTAVPCPTRRNRGQIRCRPRRAGRRAPRLDGAPRRRGRCEGTGQDADGVAALRCRAGQQQRHGVRVGATRRARRQVPGDQVKQSPDAHHGRYVGADRQSVPPTPHGADELARQRQHAIHRGHDRSRGRVRVSFEPGMQLFQRSAPQLRPSAHTSRHDRLYGCSQYRTSGRAEVKPSPAHPGTRAD